MHVRRCQTHSELLRSPLGHAALSEALRIGALSTWKPHALHAGFWEALKSVSDANELDTDEKVDAHADALVRALHTAIRAKDASRHTFVTKSDRLVRLLAEEALALLPAQPLTVETPCGPYEGVALPDGMLRFPQRCAQLTAHWAERVGAPTRSALDIGCAVGGASFGLACNYDEVVGVDLSASFVDAAKRMQAEGSLPYWLRDQGELGESRVASLLESFGGAPSGALTFRRADACALPPELVGFDAVLLANLLCRVPSPKAVLGRLGGPRGLVAPGGLAVIVSPYTWMEEHTPREVWLGGYKDADGTPVYSSETLQRELAADFTLVHDEQMPLLIREHARKYQLIISHAMVFQRRE